MDDAYLKEKKIRDKALRRKMYLSAKERIKNDPAHQARLAEQKLRMKAYRAEQNQKSKAKLKSPRQVGEGSGDSLVDCEVTRASSSNPLDLLIQTASDSTLRTLGEIISIDFRKKIRREDSE